MAKIVEYKLKKQVRPDIDADVAAGLLGLQQPQPAPTNALVTRQQQWLRVHRGQVSLKASQADHHE